MFPIPSQFHLSKDQQQGPIMPTILDPYLAQPYDDSNILEDLMRKERKKGDGQWERGKFKEYSDRKLLAELRESLQFLFLPHPPPIIDPFVPFSFSSSTSLPPPMSSSSSSSPFSSTSSPPASSSPSSCSSDTVYGSSKAKNTTERPHKCEECGKAFRFKSNLFEHKSLHLGSAHRNPFVCPFCSKTCRLKGNLKKHLQVHVTSVEDLERLWKRSFSRSSGRPRKNAPPVPLPKPGDDLGLVPVAPSPQQKSLYHVPRPFNGQT